MSAVFYIKMENTYDESVRLIAIKVLNYEKTVNETYKRLAK